MLYLQSEQRNLNVKVPRLHLQDFHQLCIGMQIYSLYHFLFFLTLIRRITKADEYIPDFKQGDTLDVTAVKLSEGKTSPPDYLTESELIGLMEHNGIGTDASIPTHINNICQRNYVQVTGSARKLVPTNLGIVLIHG